MTQGWSRSITAVALALAVGVALTGDAWPQGVTVALTPGTLQVDPGAEFDLDLTVTQAGSPFNGFDAIVGWDPAALAPVSHQEGTLMTEACGNRFHIFRPGAAADTIAVVLLCGGVSVTGPGQIYRLRFRAADTPQVTQVRFLPGLFFYNAGLYVFPVNSTDAVVTIGTVGVEPALRPQELRLRVAPNPAAGSTVFTVESDIAGPQRLRVVDPRGRLVWESGDTVATAGSRTVAWSGRDLAGRPAPAGLYLVTLAAGGRSVTNRVVLVR